MLPFHKYTGSPNWPCQVLGLWQGYIRPSPGGSITMEFLVSSEPDSASGFLRGTFRTQRFLSSNILYIFGDCESKRAEEADLTTPKC